MKYTKLIFKEIYFKMKVKSIGKMSIYFIKEKIAKILIKKIWRNISIIYHRCKKRLNRLKKTLLKNYFSLKKQCKVYIKV